MTTKTKYTLFTFFIKTILILFLLQGGFNSSFLYPQSGGLYLYTTGVSSEGCLELEWQWLPPKPTGIYGFTLYQWSEEIGEWQTASTNYDKTIKVLNVYPDLANSNTLQTWMNDPAIGLGKIIVTPITITNFNANPDLYLKSGGEYIYDAIMFGSWNTNNDKDLTIASAAAVRSFLNSGRGVIFGHDTQTSLASSGRQPNFVSLRDKTNLDIDPNDERSNLWRGSTSIKVCNDGFLLKYPHNIPYNSILSIPLTHSTGQLARGVVWMNFPTSTPSYNASPQIINGGTNDFYLTTWNNAAMIQTGHSNGNSTLDERKVLANVLWYVSQFTTDTTAKICSALDMAAPDTPTLNRYDCKYISIISNDNGSPYSFYVKATNTTNYADTCTSNILDAENKSGLKGFYVLEDNNPNGIPTPSNPGTQFIAATDNQLVTYTALDLTKYVHVRAIDFAGNLSEIVTLDPANCAAFYANNVHHERLGDTVFCNKDVHFKAEAENYLEIKWYINDVLQPELTNSLTWSKPFETENYDIKLWVRFANGEETVPPISGTLKMEVFWMKMRNVRY